MKQVFNIRPATANDAAIIASIVAMAIGDEQALKRYCGDDYLATLTAIAKAENTQYSWQNALVAEVGGQLAGAIVGYDGAQLAELREGTFSIIKSSCGITPSVADETEAGEFYLDSVGVLPEFRGIGIGRALIVALTDKARSEGHRRVGLIVDNDNPHAEALYASIGFQRIDKREFFGHQMWHLIFNTNPIK